MLIRQIKQKLYQFLRSTQKYTGTDNVYLAKGGFWLTLGQIISSFASFVLAIAFANLLDPITYGNYRYVLSLLGILVIFSLLGMETAVTRAVARGYEGSSYKAFKTKLKWGCWGSLAAIAGGFYYWYQGNTNLPIPLFLIAIFLPLMQASLIYGSFLGGRKLFSIQAKYSILSHLFSTAAIISALFLTKNLFWLVAIYLISNTLVNYFFWTLTKSKFRPNKKEDPQTLSYGKHLSFILVINRLANYLDRVLIFHYLGALDLAIYSFAIAPPEQIKALLKNIHPLALPKFAQKTKEEIKATIFKKIVKFCLFISVIVAIYIVAAPFLYKILFPRYLNSIFYSQLFSVSLIAAVVTLPLAALQAQLAKKQLYQLNIYGPLVQIVLLFLFVYFYGLWGVILARVLARFISLGLALMLVKKI